MEKKHSTVKLPGGGTFTLLSAAELTRSLVATQRVQGRFNGHEFVMLAQLEIDNNQLAMVGTSTSGNTLFSLLYRDGEINIERSAWIPEQFQPAYMLADLQMIFWPLSALQRSLVSAGLNVMEYQVAGEHIRRIMRGKKTLINIYYSHDDAWQGSVTFENTQWQYSYTINTVQVDAL